MLRGLVWISAHVRHHSHHQLLTFFVARRILNSTCTFHKKRYETKTKTTRHAMIMMLMMLSYLTGGSHVDLVKYLWLSQTAKCFRKKIVTIHPSNRPNFPLPHLIRHTWLIWFQYLATFCGKLGCDFDVDFPSPLSNNPFRSPFAGNDWLQGFSFLVFLFVS